jgi:putative ABC transport system permease protein
MGTLIQDLRYAIRMIANNPAFTAVAVLALALGVGANTAVFSVVNAVLLRPLPYAEPERLMILWEKAPKMDTSVAYPNFLDWRSGQTAFEQITAFRRESFNLIGAGEAERLQGRMVSWEFFSTFGVKPQEGRDFGPDDDRVGAGRAVILDYAFWQRRFAGDKNLIGQPLTLNNLDYTVIGVMPAQFQFGAGADLFVPLGLFAERYQDRSEHPGLYVVGRLKQDITQEQARAEMDRVMASLAAQYPDTNFERRIHIASLYDDTVQEVRPALVVLLVAVAFVLLIACINVANLLLARSATRQKEIAIRVALGASRWRIVRQLLSESLLLAFIGGGVGLLLAMWGTDMLIGWSPGSIPRVEGTSVDARVLGFTFAVSVLTGVFFGLAPALQSSRPDLNESLKEGDRGSTGRRQRTRSALVVAEVALTIVPLIGAGLAIKSIWELGKIDLGFDEKNVLSLQMSVTASPEKTQEARQFFDQVENEVGQLPGVQSVGVSFGLPFGGAPESNFKIETDGPKDERMAVMYIVSHDYFRTLGMRLISGRFFTPADTRESVPVAVIDRRLAERDFPGQDPVGKRLVRFGGQGMFEIVGVVEPVKHYGLEGQVPVDAQMYYNLAQVPDNIMPFIIGRMHLIARTSGDPTSLASGVRAQIAAINKDQPVFDIKSMEQRVADSIGGRRFTMLLLTVFASVALLLAAVGVYGVMSYSVAQRTHEIGIRMALGASSGDVMRLVVGRTMLLVAVGVALGLTAAFALTRWMSSMLYGVSSTDPVTFAVISLLLIVVALLASAVPARRATRVDPMVALRHE